MEEIELDNAIGWLRKRIPLEDVYVDHVKFIMKQYAKLYHENEIKKTEISPIVSCCDITDDWRFCKTRSTYENGCCGCEFKKSL